MYRKQRTGECAKVCRTPVKSSCQRRVTFAGSVDAVESERHEAPHSQVNSPVVLDNDDSVLASILPVANVIPLPADVQAMESLNTCTKDVFATSVKIPPAECIDATWLEIGSVKLLASDKEIISSSKGLLNDKIIHAALLLLQSQYPQQAGLVDPILCSAGHANVDSANKSFVQVFNDPVKTHWITVTNNHRKVGEIDVYCSAHLKPSVPCANAVSRFARVPAPTMELRIANVARQSDEYSCGLYAVAFAVALVFGKDPCNLVFQQNAMRQHLIACLERGLITEFPLQSFRAVRKVVLDKIQHEVLCVCRSVYQKRRDKMIECQLCFVWFHPSCAGLSDASFLAHQQDKQKQFKCPSCSMVQC